MSTTTKEEAPRITLDDAIRMHCQKNGLRYGGKRRKGTGYTVFFHTGEIGAVTVSQYPAKKLVRSFIPRKRKAKKVKNDSK